MNIEEETCSDSVVKIPSYVISPKAFLKI